MGLFLFFIPRTCMETKAAIVAALKREVAPLVSRWQRSRKEFEGREFEFFASGSTLLVCGGIGAQSARRAAEAVIQFYHPDVLISAGFAGALQSDLRVGEVITPRTVIDASDGSRSDTGRDAGILVSYGAIADAVQKQKLARAFGAQAVDMEAAAVARGAEAHGVRFMACKAISDDSDFSMPELAHFVDADGRFQTGKFAVHVALRPWLWADTMRLARGSALACKNLCQALTALTDLETHEPIAMQVGVSVKS